MSTADKPTATGAVTQAEDAYRRRQPEADDAQWSRTVVVFFLGVPTNPTSCPKDKRTNRATNKITNMKM